MRIGLFFSLALLLPGCVGSVVDTATEASLTTASIATDIGINATAGAVDVIAHDHGEIEPFDERENPHQQVDIALAAAEVSGKTALLIFGGNWCHDSRGLAHLLQEEAMQNLMREEYIVTWIDVGRRDRNLDVVRRFTDEKMVGTPTIIIANHHGEVLNSETMHDWRNAASRTPQEAHSYFAQFVAD